MQLRKLLDDDDAVSPVIGVILMVAITVILAAVIATFVLGLGEQVSQTAPQASFTFDYDAGADPSDQDSYNYSPSAGSSGGDGILTLTHAGGATLTASDLDVIGSSPSGGPFTDATDPNFQADSEITAGTSLDVWIAADDVIRVTWTSDDGQDSATLADYTGPGN